jgi:hypothetical protein
MPVNLLRSAIEWIASLLLLALICVAVPLACIAFLIFVCFGSMTGYFSVSHGEVK